VNLCVIFLSTALFPASTSFGTCAIFRPRF
jgi:hypothetical protein